jgi:hypothetical protein
MSEQNTFSERLKSFNERNEFMDTALAHVPVGATEEEMDICEQLLFKMFDANYVTPDKQGKK